MPNNTLDAIDRKIIALLQEDGRMTNAALAEQVNLTAPSVFERVRKLEQRGVIKRYTVEVDAAALDKSLTAFLRITLAYDERFDAGLRALRDDPDILECYSVAGEDCLIIKTRVENTAALEALIKRVRSHVTVLRSVTMIALSALKEAGPLDVGLPAEPSAAPANGHTARAGRAGRAAAK
jgi:Lrp/AsnC family transcriptional regulator, leucine-responsive regulatory protein